MPDSLPSIDLAVHGSPLSELRAFAETARQSARFKVELIENFMSDGGLHVLNLRYLGNSTHEQLGAQFISRTDLKARLAIEVRATRWEPEDPPTYEIYCAAARELLTPLIKDYNSQHKTRYRLRVPSKNSLQATLTPASAVLFGRFTKLANKSALHPLDWGRFYEFVWKSRSAPVYEEQMTQLLKAQGFSDEYAERISSVYSHLCSFKAHR
ncbi:MAG: hypothetical protein IH627_11265 [Rubrivivax sp.]|nr:hypothetical protein [Rubrivivax sp.]